MTVHLSSKHTTDGRRSRRALMTRFVCLLSALNGRRVMSMWIVYERASGNGLEMSVLQSVQLRLFDVVDRMMSDATPHPPHPSHPSPPNHHLVAPAHLGLDASASAASASASGAAVSPSSPRRPNPHAPERFLLPPLRALPPCHSTVSHQERKQATKSSPSPSPSTLSLITHYHSLGIIDVETSFNRLVTKS